MASLISSCAMGLFVLFENWDMLLYLTSFWIIKLWTSVCIFLSCAERVYLHPCRPGRCPDRERLLGALLPWARRRPWRSLPGCPCRGELPWRSIQHFLQYRELWATCSPGDIRRPGAHSGWWAVVSICFSPPLLISFLLLNLASNYVRLYSSGDASPSAPWR